MIQAGFLLTLVPGIIPDTLRVPSRKNVLQHIVLDIGAVVVMCGFMLPILEVEVPHGHHSALQLLPLVHERVPPFLLQIPVLGLDVSIK